jgi:hypothetical protein
MEKDYQHYVINKYLIAAGIENDDIVVKENKIAIIINGIMKNPYILLELKENLKKQDEISNALAQIVLTYKKYNIFGKYYGVFSKYKNGDLFIFFEHDDNIFHSMALDVNKENFNAQGIPSKPTQESVIQVKNILKDKLTIVKNERIIKVVKNLFGDNLNIIVNNKNVISVFLKWLNEIKFDSIDENERDNLFIDLFFTDLINETNYKRKEQKNKLLNLCGVKFKIQKIGNKILFIEISDNGSNKSYVVKDVENYNNFWKIYRRPIDEDIFIEIYKNRDKFFSNTYRNKVGAQYTPKILVNLQNEILKKNNINVDDYVVFDPCCGTANLQDDFKNKNSCFLSTLDAGDVFVAKSKGFENVIQFDFLKDDKMPKWNYNDKLLTINEISKLENKEILVIMNPPYEKEKFIIITEKIVKNITNCKFFLYSNSALFEKEFYFNRLLKLNPFIVSNNIINAKIFNINQTLDADSKGISNWGLSMTLFSFNKNNSPFGAKVNFTRYELKNSKKTPVIKKQCCQVVWNCKKELYKHYLKERLKKYEDDAKIILGNYNILTNGMFISNKINDKYPILTDVNLELVFCAGGILYNTHPEYWEYEIIKAPEKELSDELKANCIISNLFYINNKTINTKEYKNYFMPFTESEIFGEDKHRLNCIIDNNSNNKDRLFDFREWLKPYKQNMSKEAKELYDTSLEIYKFYFEYFKDNTDIDYNVGWMQLKDSLLQGIAINNNDKQQKLTKKNIITGFSTRIGKDATWRPSILDKRYNTNIFTKYDNALVNLFERIQLQMIEHGILETKMARLR